MQVDQKAGAPEKAGKRDFKAEFQQAVKAQIGGDKHHGWGADDSFAVIDSLCEVEPEAEPFIRAVINPSAFRQVLESQKLLNEKPKDQKGRRGGVAALLS